MAFSCPIIGKVIYNYISVSELCLKNALGLLINNRSNFWEERIIVRKIAATFQREQVIAQNFEVNHQAKWIIIQKIAQIKKIGVMNKLGNFIEISFQAKFVWKATKSEEFRWNLFGLLLHNTDICLKSFNALHLFSVRMAFALTLNQNSRVVFCHNNLCKICLQLFSPI